MSAKDTMQDLTKDERKALIKEAINEWLDSQFIKLGKWTMGGMCAAGVAAIGYFILTSNGWHK